jgi:hypothetical protein
MNKKEIEAFMKSDHFTTSETDQETLLRYGYTVWKLQSYIYPLMDKDEEGNWIDVQAASAVEVNAILNRSGFGLQ